MLTKLHWIDGPWPANLQFRRPTNRLHSDARPSQFPLVQSLASFRRKTRGEWTMLDGHHRIYILKSRGEDVNAWPRVVIERDPALPE